MKIIEWPQFLENGFSFGPKKTSVTIGVFDGVHLGHQALLKRIVSHNPSYIPVAVTFRHYNKGKENTSYIQTFQQRITMLKKLGVETVLVIDFSESFSCMTGTEFLEILLRYGNIGFLAVGVNFRCGYNLDTDADSIKDFFALQGIPVEIVPEVMQGSLPISSSRIRSAIAAGDFQSAQAMLGHII